MPKKISIWISIIGIIVTFIVGVFLGPYMQAFFAASFAPKPVLNIVEDKCAVVPLGGTNYIFCKIVVENNGQQPATPLSLFVEVNSPYVVGDENKTYADFSMGGIRSQQTLLISFKVTNTLSTVEHGSLTIKARIESPNSWDEYSFSESW